MARFNHKRFDEWEAQAAIPKEIMDMVEWIADKIGYPVEEETIRLTNRMGDTIGFARGFIVTHCTSSMLDGPSVDYAPTFIKWLKGLGFVQGRSYGDNGLDSATNWHDTFWHKEIIYAPSKIYDDFIEFDSEDEAEDYYESLVMRDYYGDE